MTKVDITKSVIFRGMSDSETYALLKVEPLLVDAVANQDSRVLFLNMGSIGRASDSYAWRLKLISNMLSISMRKNLMLSGRIFHTSPKSIRGRVTSYLSSVSLKTGSDEFDIPFDRQQLADYLNIERTALSKELGKMQSDGLIRVKKNHFKLEH